MKSTQTGLSERVDTINMTLLTSQNVFLPGNLTGPGPSGTWPRAKRSRVSRRVPGHVPGVQPNESPSQAGSEAGQ